jgi:hypothetical protein
VFTKSKFVRVVLPFLLAASVLTIASPSASAAGITYPCNSGQTYRVTAGVVSDGRYCTGTFTIDASATSIGDYAFQSGTAIQSVTIQSGVTSIGEAAFYGASSLNAISLPSSLQSIGASAFRFTAFTSFTIPSGVNSIGTFALINMTSLTSFMVDSSNANFSAVGGVLFNKLQTQLIQYPRTTTATSYVVPSSVTTISSYSFYDISSLTSITFPSTVTSFGSNIFPFMFSPITSYTYCGDASLSGTGITGTPTSCSTAPGAPTIGTAIATGTTTATVAFTAPASDGGETILSYTATSSPGSVTATITQATSGTISVTGLSPSTSYTFTITALNSIGASSASAASNSITTLPTPDSDPITTPPTRDSGPPASFLIVKTSPTISLTADVYTCTAGTLIFWRYSVTEEPSKLAYQKISLLRNGTEVASFVTLNPLATFEKTSTWTGSTMTCQIYAAQENTVSTFSSLGSAKYDEAAKAQGGAIKAADLKYSSDRKAAYDKRAAGLLRISDARRQELSQAKTWAQTRAAEAKYRAGLLQTLVALNKEFEINKQERARAKADAAKAFTQGLNNLGVAIIQP